VSLSPQAAVLETRERDARRTRAHVALLAGIAVAYFLVVMNPGYEAYLDDETRFLAAIRENTLAFFPGYVGFLTTARLLMEAVSPGAALQLISAFFGALSVAAFWAGIETPSLVVKTLGAVAYGTSVYHLYNSSVGTTYTAEAFAFLAVGLLCRRSESNPRLLYGAAAVLAIAGAFRQTTPFFLLPLFLYSCYRARQAGPVGLAGVLSLAWLIPTVMHFGGAGGAAAAGAAQVSDAVLPSTLLSSVKGAAANVIRFVVYLFYGAHLLLPAAALRMRAFEWLWIGPAALFYAFFYVSWPGYVLGVLAVIFLLGVATVARMRRPVAIVALAAVCLINLAQFLVARPIHNPGNTAAAIASTYAFQYSRAGIAERYQARLRDVLSRISRQ
jgi:hypothetical protein